MTSRWPLRSKLTSNHQINPFIWFLDPKNPLKVVSHMGPIFWWFFSIFLYFAYYFLPLGQKCHRVKWSDNLRWFRYPITFKKKQVPKNPWGGAWAMLALGLISSWPSNWPVARTPWKKCRIEMLEAAIVACGQRPQGFQSHISPRRPGGWSH